MTDTERKRIDAICEVAGVKEIDDLSDGFHTFRQLYYQRMMLFATIVKQNKDKAWKSLRHEDGELCFGGGWFIVGVDTPEGSYTYHYENKYFDLFDCEILDYGKHWDGHTEKDITRLLSLESNNSEIPNSSDCIDRAEAQTAIQFAARRYTVAHEAHGEGHVVWSDNLISVTDAMNALREVPSAQPEKTQLSGESTTKDSTFDCISRHDFDKYLENAEKEAIKNKKYVFASALNTIRGNLRNFPSAQPEQRWIPCVKRLPEEGREVLGTDTYGRVRHVIKDKCGENEFATYEEMMHIPIIAWTLMPDPYQRGEKND